ETASAADGLADAAAGIGRCGVDGAGCIEAETAAAAAVVIGRVVGANTADGQVETVFRRLVRVEDECGIDVADSAAAAADRLDDDSNRADAGRLGVLGVVDVVGKSRVSANRAVAAGGELHITAGKHQFVEDDGGGRATATGDCLDNHAVRELALGDVLDPVDLDGDLAGRSVDGDQGGDVTGILFIVATEDIALGAEAQLDAARVSTARADAECQAGPAARAAHRLCEYAARVDHAG